MDTQNSSVAEIPSMKLAKVGKGREKKRGGAGWLSGARGAGSAFSGAAGGSGMAGAAGMSLGKILMILAISGGISAGAWQMGNHIAASSAAGVQPSAPKVFDSKDSGKYADTSGVIKQDNSIPNSLGYVNNDGLTDEQRAAKKAADEAAAAKAASDAQAKADADAKAKAAADATAASAAPEPAAPAAAAPDDLKKALTPAKFGGMNSSFAGGGGGGLSGGAGLSGGINGNFGAMGGLGNKALGGALAAFRSPSRAATSRAGALAHGHSNSKGFAKQQLDNANGLSRTALASGKAESAAAGAAAPFDNNPSQGSVISGPGLGTGTQTGPADSGGSTNMNSNSGGPIGGNGAACQDANYAPDIQGNCTLRTQTPKAKNAAPYQGLIDACMIMLGIIAVLSVIDLMMAKAGWTLMATPTTAAAGAALIAHARMISLLIAAMGAAIVGMGVAIATMKHGDFMIGGILGLVGGYIGWTALVTWGSATTSTAFAPEVAHVLIASAIGELAAASTKATSMM